MLLHLKRTVWVIGMALGLMLIMLSVLGRAYSLETAAMVTKGLFSPDTSVITTTLYLPFVLKPPPTLSPIVNNGDGNFTVYWQSIGSGYIYILEEDTEPTFTAPHSYLPTPELSQAIQGLVHDIYYYRFKAIDEEGRESIWSNIETAVVTYLTVDDFDAGPRPNSPNLIGGFISHAWPPGCGTPLTHDYDPANGYGGISYGYRISYQATPTCYATWQTGLQNQDYGGFSDIEFQVKGALGGESIHVYLQDNYNRRSYIAFNNLSDTWQEIRIPLHTFADQGVDLSNLAYFQIVFEWANLNGTIYVDDIRFE